MSNILHSTSQDPPPHRHRLNSSSTISAIRHVQFHRPSVDHGKRGQKSTSRGGTRNSLDDVNDVDEKSEISLEENIGALAKIAWKQRIKHFTWTWFTMTMATGGIANVMYVVMYAVAWRRRVDTLRRHSIPQPFRIPHLYALGAIFFILNIVLFLFNIAMISTRFYLYPSTFRASFVHPTESLFVPAAIISFGTILINITQYGIGRTGSWLENTMVVMFWIYCTLAVLFSCGIYLLM